MTALFLQVCFYGFWVGVVSLICSLISIFTSKFNKILSGSSGILTLVWFVYLIKIRFSHGGRVCAGDFFGDHEVKVNFQESVGDAVEVVQNGDIQQAEDAVDKFVNPALSGNLYMPMTGWWLQFVVIFVACMCCFCCTIATMAVISNHRSANNW